MNVESMRYLLSTLTLATAVASQSRELQFVERQPLPTANPTRELCTADFDGDGDTDVLIAELSQLSLLTNDGTGRFERTTIPASSYNFVLAGDMDGDGDIDAVAGGGGSTTVLLRNDGTGSLSVHPSGITQTVTGEGALLDLDGDGDLDLVFAQLLGSFFVAFNDGAGNLTLGASPLAPAPGGLYSRFVVADFNGDGRDDFVATGTSAYYSLSAPQGYVNGDTSLFLQNAASAVADFDFDGNLDLVLADANGGRLLLGVGDGTFTQSSATFPARGLQRLVAGDLDEDGDVDLAGIAAVNSQTPLYLWFDVGGEFVEVQGERFAPISTRSAVRIAAADLDGDRDLDIYIGCSVLGLGSEPDFVAVNRHVQVELDGPVGLGGSLDLGCSSQPGYGTGIDLFLTVVGFEAPAMPTPFGDVRVAAAGAISLPFVALSSPIGHGTLRDPVPNDPNLLGLEMVVQGLVLDFLGPDAPRLTNFERITVE